VKPWFSSISKKTWLERETPLIEAGGLAGSGAVVTGGGVGTGAGVGVLVPVDGVVPSVVPEAGVPDPEPPELGTTESKDAAFGPVAPQPHVTARIVRAMNKRIARSLIISDQGKLTRHKPESGNSADSGVKLTNYSLIG
jgi:hypothetical protein